MANKKFKPFQPLTWQGSADLFIASSIREAITTQSEVVQYSSSNFFFFVCCCCCGVVAACCNVVSLCKGVVPTSNVLER